MLLLSQVAYIVFLPFWLLFAGVVLLGTETDGLPVWLALLSVLTWAYPIALIVVIVASWKAARRGDRDLALRWNLLPLAWIAPIGLVLVWANLAG